MWNEAIKLEYFNIIMNKPFYITWQKSMIYEHVKLCENVKLSLSLHRFWIGHNHKKNNLLNCDMKTAEISFSGHILAPNSKWTCFNLIIYWDRPWA